MASRASKANTDLEGVTVIDALDGIRSSIDRIANVLVALLESQNSDKSALLESQSREGLADVKNRVIEIVSETGGLSKSAVTAKAGGAAATVAMAIKGLMSDGLIVANKSGGKSHAQLLYLPEGG